MRQHDLRNHSDLVVVGGGIVGLAVARELLARQPGASPASSSASPSSPPTRPPTRAASSTPAIYYEPGSLKARLCVEGARDSVRLLRRARDRGAADGKLIVAATEERAAAPRRAGAPGDRERGAGPAPDRRRRDRRDRAARPRASPRCTPRTRASSTSRGRRGAFAADVREAGGRIVTGLRGRRASTPDGSGVSVEQPRRERPSRASSSSARAPGRTGSRSRPAPPPSRGSSPSAAPT